MRNQALRREDEDLPGGDQLVQLHGTFKDFETLLRIRGEVSSPRIAYLDGTIEIMAPSRAHEGVKSHIGCLVETYCLVRSIRFQTVGSWTLKEKREESGVEPDECYILGLGKPDRPDLAIEVIWTPHGMNKLEIYRRLNVREVWVWRRGAIQVHAHRGDRYEPVPASEVLPGLDLEQLVSFIDRPSTYDAVVDYRAALEAIRPVPPKDPASPRRRGSRKA